MSQQLPLRFDAYSVQEFISRRARRVRVEVRGADQVRLVIPQRASRSQAREFLQSRHDWIQSALARMRERAENTPAPTSLRWDGADRLSLRGREVPLHIVAAKLRKAAVRFDQAITVTGAPTLLGDHVRLRRVLLRAFREQARIQARQLIEVEAGRLGLRVSALRIADQRSLWGSCSPAGRVCLNWRLLMAPPDVFRYVVIHELAHRVHHNHSARFWALVARQMPDYHLHRGWLRRHGAALHRVLPAE